MKMGVFVSDYALTTDTLQRLGSKETGLILVANGVYHATLKENGASSKLLDMTGELYALGEDLQTRGIAEGDIDSRVKVLSYGDLVDVIFDKYEKIAWL